MGLKKIALMIGCLWIGMGAGHAQDVAPEEANVLMIRQDFLKLGKKEAYESLRKSWLQGLKQFSMSSKQYVPPIISIQDMDAPMYASLDFLPNFSGIDTFFLTKKAFREASPEKQWNDRSDMMNSCLNFEINSLHVYLPQCSYALPGMAGSMFNLPYIHYFIFTLLGNSVSDFEMHLQKMVSDQAKSKSSCYWRVWKVVFGGAVPKYIVCAFAKTEDALKKGLDQLPFNDASTKQMVIRQREGRAMVRPDLSLMMGTK